MYTPYPRAAAAAPAPAKAGDERPLSAITTGLVVVSVVFPILSAISIYLRFYVRRRSPREFAWDDIWLCVAWLSTLAIAILVWACAGISGIDHYTVDTKKGNFVTSLLILVSSIIIQLPLAAVKVSILLFYRRVFPTRKFRICVWVAIAVITIWAIIFFFLVLFQKRWFSDLLNGTGEWLLDSPTVGLAQVGTSIALDLIVLTFPLPVIFSLKMNNTRKIAVALIFWLGAFCVVTAIVRLVYLNRSIREITEDHGRVYLQSSIFIWKMIEPNVSIIAANLPLYGPLLKGGRGPESIVRSVRSVLSLGSSRSNHSKSSRSAKSKRDNGIEDVSLVGSAAGGGHQQWPGKGQQEAQCVAGKTSEDIELDSIDHHRGLGGGIEVRHGVSVVTS
ncbi:hypothetical protein GGS20DRAFT_235023 [Poronia punctata]|nr:hypothetical protein GGS20DRAFT_235023 [Poronia punctata]